MKKNILSMAVLLMASAAVFTACSSDDNITGEQPANPTGKYTMTINASKGGDATTRALSLGRNDADTKNVLNATWDANEVVLVYQGGSQIGTLYSAASATNETSLTGTLDSAPDAGQDLTLYFHTATDPATTDGAYAGQDGTLAKIASTYDFCAPATITAGSFTVSGNTVSTTSSVSFGANQQVIVKFTLKDKDSEALLNASKVTAKLTAPGVVFTTTEFNIPSTTYETNGPGVVYFAIQNFPANQSDFKSYANLEFTATVGDDTYTYTKNGWPFEDGKYYEITVKMALAYPLLSAATTADHGKVVCADGHLHPAKTAVPSGCTAVGILGKVTATGHGLILALQNATNQSWNTIDSWASASYAGTTLKVLPDDAARGANLTSYNKLGETTVSNWAVAQKSDYDAIFKNLGSAGKYNSYSYDNNVNAYFTTGVGGSELSLYYWSATESYIDDTEGYNFYGSFWGTDKKSMAQKLRPVLGF